MVSNCRHCTAIFSFSVHLVQFFHPFPSPRSTNFCLIVRSEGKKLRQLLGKKMLERNF